MSDSNGHGHIYFFLLFHKWVYNKRGSVFFIIRKTCNVGLSTSAGAAIFEEHPENPDARRKSDALLVRRPCAWRSST